MNQREREAQLMSNVAAILSCADSHPLMHLLTFTMDPEECRTLAIVLAGLLHDTINSWAKDMGSPPAEVRRTYIANIVADAMRLRGDAP